MEIYSQSKIIFELIVTLRIEEFSMITIKHTIEIKQMHQVHF